MGQPTRRRSPIEWRRAVRAWFLQHAQACVFSVGQLVRNPIGSLLTIAVIGISLALPAGFYLLLVNAQRVTSGWGGSAQITLFLKLELDDFQAQAVADRLRDHPQIDAVSYVSREQGLAEYREMSGFGDALDTLEENPLPAVILVQPNLEALSGGQGDRLLAALRAIPEVDTAQFDRQWVQRLFAIMEILKRAAVIMAILLALAVLLIIGNTIRLAIFNRRAEIEINLLFGATHAFVRRPFLYSGFIHGAAGALLAWLLINGSIRLLSGPVFRLSELYSSRFALAGLDFGAAGYLIGIGGLLGLAGSWIAVQRHLRDSGLV